MIPYGRQSIDAADVEAVVATLRSDWLTQGPAVEAFESEIARYCDVPYAVAFANASLGLIAAAVAADIGPGDRVGVPAVTFFASVNGVLEVGATPVMLDVDPVSANLIPRAIPELDALVAVHYSGLPVDLEALEPRPRIVIEDAAHALGASTPLGPVGNCAASDMCVFSFHPVKSVTAGEGGVVTTRSEVLAERLRRFRNHGIVRRPDVAPWAYEVASRGTNGRLSDIHAALGRSQLQRLDQFVARRNALAERYDDAFAASPIGVPAGVPQGWVHARHIYPVRVEARDIVYEKLRADGIGSQVHYVPLTRHPVLARYGLVADDYPGTEAYFARTLSIPLYPDLTEAEQDEVIAAICRATS